MKKVSKKFWIDNDDLDSLNNPELLCGELMLFGNDRTHKNEIEISWFEPEKKVEVTESDFDGIWSKWLCEENSDDFVVFLKQELFKDKV